LRRRDWSTLLTNNVVPFSLNPFIKSKIWAGEDVTASGDCFVVLRTLPNHLDTGRTSSSRVLCILHTSQVLASGLGFV